MLAQVVHCVDCCSTLKPCTHHRPRCAFAANSIEDIEPFRLSFSLADTFFFELSDDWEKIGGGTAESTAFLIKEERLIRCAVAACLTLCSSEG